MARCQQLFGLWSRHNTDGYAKPLDARMGLEDCQKGNVASGVGRVPFPGSATYSATKHGVVGLTESLRLEYRRSGVRFSLVLPAQVETAMIEGQARQFETPAALVSRFASLSRLDRRARVFFRRPGAPRCCSEAA